MNWLSSIGTVRVCADPAVVVSCATEALLLLTVIVTPPPALIACNWARFALPASGGPVRTMNGWSIDSEVVEVARFSMRSAGCTIVSPPLPAVKPGADAVMVTGPAAPSTPCT